jgi:hypothetical protein
MNPEERRAYMKKYREEHREEINARKRKYYAEHKEENRAWQKKYREKHPEKIAAIKHNYYMAHKDKILARNREYARIHRKEDQARRLSWETCNILRAHKDALSDDPERLTTDFIMKIVKGGL